MPGSSTSSGAGKIIGTSLQNIGKAANNLPLQLAGVGINGERVIHRAVFLLRALLVCSRAACQLCPPCAHPVPTRDYAVFTMLFGAKQKHNLGVLQAQ